MRFQLLFLFCLSLSIVSCHSTAGKTCIINQGPSKIKVIMNEDKGICSSLSSYLLQKTGELKLSDWKLNYPAYHFECADMDEDGTEDILLGVIKRTRFDSVNRKRIFTFKLVEGHIRPLWLGSRVSQPLEDFKVIKQGAKNRIRTIESEENGKFLIADYKWKGFGLTFIHYLARNLNADSVRIIFNTISNPHENS